MKKYFIGAFFLACFCFYTGYQIANSSLKDNNQARNPTSINETNSGGWNSSDR